MDGRVALAGLNGAAAVAFASFGAHALPADMTERLRHAFETGADFHLLNAVLVAAIAIAGGSLRLGAAYWLLLVGSLVFAISLYALSLTGVSALGAITPVGGLIMIAGWLALALSGLRRL